MEFLFVILFLVIVYGAFRLGVRSARVEKRKVESSKKKKEVDTDMSKMENPNAQVLVMSEKLDKLSNNEKTKDTIKPKSDGKTEYRILSETNYLSDKWLQFKDSKGEWRLVPSEIAGKVLDISNERECPKNVPEMYCNNFLNCFEGHEKDLKMHTNKWTDMDDYFSHIKNLHQNYKIKEEKKKSKSGSVENL